MANCYSSFLSPSTIKANAELIVQAVNSYQSLKDENERLKRDKALAMRLAMEFGYKQCEKGNNIEMAFINLDKLLTQQ
jgi:hypothetical protein